MSFPGVIIIIIIVIIIIIGINTLKLQEEILTVPVWLAVRDKLSFEQCVQTTAPTDWLTSLHEFPVARCDICTA